MRSAARRASISGIPSRYTDAYFYADFTRSIAAVNGRPVSLSSLLSTTRTSSGYAPNAAGVYTSFASNVPRITNLGLLVEGQIANHLLHCRDFTQTSWVKTTMSVALNAVGIDGTSNSASTLTATSANAMVLQTVTVASATESFSVFLKRVSGTGTINISLNGGSSWTSVVLTTAWQRFQIEATIANPSVGIQIVTNGDVIAADFAQCESQIWATSPILTTTAAVTRTIDVVTAPLVNPPAPFTIIAYATPQSPSANAASQTTFAYSDGTNSNRLAVVRTASTGVPSAAYTVATVNPGSNSPSNVWATNTLGVIAYTISIDQCSALNWNQSAKFNLAANSLLRLAAILNFGTSGLGAGAWQGTIQRLAVIKGTRNLGRLV